VVVGVVMVGLVSCRGREGTLWGWGVWFVFGWWFCGGFVFVVWFFCRRWDTFSLLLPTCLVSFQGKVGTSINDGN